MDRLETLSMYAVYVGHSQFIQLFVFHNILIGSKERVETPRDKPMDTSDIISLAISGAASIIAFTALYLNLKMRRPKIKGRVNTILLRSVRTPDDPKATKTIALLVHITLTNLGRDPIHIVDYSIDCDVGHGYEPLERFDNVQKMTIPPIHGFIVDVDDWRELQVFYPWKPVEFGKPLTGFLIADFPIHEPMTDPAADIEKHAKTISAVRVTLKDVFDKKPTRFQASKSQFIKPARLLWLIEMGGIKVRPQ